MHDLVTMVNLKTGDTQEYRATFLKEAGFPFDYVDVASVTPSIWIEALQEANRRSREQIHTQPTWHR